MHIHTVRYSMFSFIGVTPDQNIYCQNTQDCTWETEILQCELTSFAGHQLLSITCSMLVSLGHLAKLVKLMHCWPSLFLLLLSNY